MESNKKTIITQKINTIPPLRTDTKLVISDLEKCKFFSDILHNTMSFNHVSNPNNDIKVKRSLELPHYLVQNDRNYVTPN